MRLKIFLIKPLSFLFLTSTVSLLLLPTPQVQGSVQFCTNYMTQSNLTLLLTDDGSCFRRELFLFLKEITLLLSANYLQLFTRWSSSTIIYGASTFFYTQIIGH